MGENTDDVLRSRRDLSKSMVLLSLKSLEVDCAGARHMQVLRILQISSSAGAFCVTIASTIIALRHADTPVVVP